MNPKVPNLISTQQVQVEADTYETTTENQVINQAGL